MSRRRWIIFGVIGAVLAAIAVVVIQVIVVVARLEKRLKLADEHAPIVRRVLQADGRFSEVRAERFTAKNGCLLVSAVAQPGSVDDLKRLVESTSPPVPVAYDIFELKAPATRPAR